MVGLEETRSRRFQREGKGDFGDALRQSALVQDVDAVDEDCSELGERKKESVCKRVSEKKKEVTKPDPLKSPSADQRWRTSSFECKPHL